MVGLSECPECIESRRNGYRYCRNCGNPIERDVSATFTAGIIITAICVVLLIIEVFTGFFRSGEVFSYLYDSMNRFIVITPMPVTLFTISGVTLQIYYIILLFTVLACVSWLIWKAVGPLMSYIKDRDTESIKETGLFESSVLFAALYLIQMIFIMILIAMGVDTSNSLPDEEWELMFLLLDASVWEEVISRILLIGVPLLIIALIMKKYRPDDMEEGRDVKWWRYIIGGSGVTKISVIFVFFSAAMFGIAHIPGWDLWKAFPTFLFGLIAGYLFVKYGVYVTIAIHFLTDYIMAPGWLFPGGDAIASLLILLMAVLAIPYVWMYMKRGISYFRNWNGTYR